MATAIAQVPVATSAQLEQTVTSYIAQGFTVANRTSESVTMLKKKEFSILWAVIGFVVCLIPLLIYLIVYATQQDQMVQIRLDPMAALGTGAASIQMSPDGCWWWDGGGWQDAITSSPPTAQYSADRCYWWDGNSWRPVAIENSTVDPASAPSPLDHEDTAAPLSEASAIASEPDEDKSQSAGD
jgi:hypothetical protein